MRHELLTINNNINGKLLEAFYADTWHEFFDMYSDITEYIYVLYCDGTISKQVKMYYKRKAWGVKNSYKEIHMYSDKARNKKHKFC